MLGVQHESVDDSNLRATVIEIRPNIEGEVALCFVEEIAWQADFLVPLS